MPVSITSISPSANAVDVGVPVTFTVASLVVSSCVWVRVSILDPKPVDGDHLRIQHRTEAFAKFALSLALTFSVTVPDNVKPLSGRVTKNSPVIFSVPLVELDPAMVLILNVVDDAPRAKSIYL
jgi:hypothetical protein